MARAGFRSLRVITAMLCPSAARNMPMFWEDLPQTEVCSVLATPTRQSILASQLIISLPSPALTASNPDLNNAGARFSPLATWNVESQT
jgi:hypothetical protein